MTMQGAGPALRRSQRKQDLLLASQLARGQAVGAFNELAGRADAVVHRVQQLRAWFSSPLVWMAGSALGTVALRAGLRRRGRTLRLVRWGWLAWRVWRVWRSAAPALARYRAARS